MIDTPTKLEPNWSICTNLRGLQDIHQDHVNIAICDRDIEFMKSEINTLLDQDIKLKAQGDIDEIMDEVKRVLAPRKYQMITKDIRSLLSVFKEVTDSKSFKLLLATVNTNMCRRFHTDVNDLRMLCTYSGPGTLWLAEDNINREALNANGYNESIVRDKKRINQVKTGSVIILKGAIYPKEGANAIVHRSPTIEESSERRLLLRIDTNEFLNFQFHDTSNI